MTRSESRRTGSDTSQRGFSLVGFLCALLLLVAGGWIGFRVGPSVLEYWAVKEAVTTASTLSDSPRQLRETFDRLANAAFIDSICGKDLEIAGQGKEMQVSFAYEKRIPLAGPVSLLIEYKGSSAPNVPEKAAN